MHQHHQISVKNLFHILEIPNKTPERVKAVGTKVVEETMTTFPDIPSEFIPADLQRGIPKLAKDPLAAAQISSLLLQIPTQHEIRLGDSRHLDISQPIHLVVTSPPYWTLKKYPASEGQLGQFHSSIANHRTTIPQEDQKNKRQSKTCVKKKNRKWWR